MIPLTAMEAVQVNSALLLLHGSLIKTPSSNFQANFPELSADCQDTSGVAADAATRQVS